MKKTLLLLCLLTVWLGVWAQTDSTAAPYKRFPVLPPIQILLGDSATRFTKEGLKKKTTLLMLFSPDCSHCQHETEELVKNRDLLKDLQIVMITFHPLWQMNAFVEQYRVRELPDVVVGKDIYTLLPSFYDLRNLPFHALYNKKGNLVYASDGSLPLEKLLQLVKEN